MRISSCSSHLSDLVEEVDGHGGDRVAGGIRRVVHVLLRVLVDLLRLEKLAV